MRGYDQHLNCHPYELFFNGVMNKQLTVTRGYDQCPSCNPLGLWIKPPIYLFFFLKEKKHELKTLRIA